LTRNARKLARIRQQQMAIGEIIERTDFLH
jgi:hypothetical protein